MYRVFTATAPEWAHLVQHVLQSRGIASTLRHEQLARIESVAPFFVEIWVEDAVQAREAEQIVRALLAEHDPEEDAEPGEAWRCEQCEEQIPPQFTACWNCGWSRL